MVKKAWAQVIIYILNRVKVLQQVVYGCQSRPYLPAYARKLIIVENKTFKNIFPEGITGDTLTRPPKGYEETNPAIEYIKRKSFIVTRSFTDPEVQSKNFVRDVAKTFQAMKPLIDFLNIVVE